VDERLCGKMLSNSSGIHCRHGDVTTALELAEEGMAAFDSVCYRRGVVWALSNKANAADR